MPCTVMPCPVVGSGELLPNEPQILPIDGDLLEPIPDLDALTDFAPGWAGGGDPYDGVKPGATTRANAVLGDRAARVVWAIAIRHRGQPGHQSDLRREQ